MKTISIRVEDIEIGERHRALSDDAVTRLAASLSEIGLRQPITIRVVDEMMVDGHLTAGVPVLVAGRHRLEAAKQLGWSHIDCIEVDDEILAAEMWEIAENLHRLDLTKEQRDEHIRRYAELLEERKALEVVGQNVPKPKSGPQGGRPKEVARQIADETGLSAKTIRRALNPQIVPIKSALEPETEAEAIIREANAIVSAWNRARQPARDLALEQIDTPVFDRSRAAG
jgi:hypothetical protein